MKRALDTLPEISRQIVEEIDDTNETKSLDCVENALNAYERKWLLKRVNEDFALRLRMSKKAWKEELARGAL
jgi:hypothetical protein